MKQICTLAFLFVFLSASAAFAAGADPLKVHEAGFGPEIQGLRLGKSMTWPQMINTQRDIISKPRHIGGIPVSMPAIFGMIISDNYKAASHKWTNGKFPTNLPGKWLVVSFSGIAGQARVSNSGGGIGSKVPKSGTLDDLFVILKKNGLNYIAAPNIILRDERVIQYSVDKKDLPTEAATVGDFAQWLSQSCNLGTMEQKGKNYEARNPDEGWRVVVTDEQVEVFSMPIPEAQSGK